MAQRGMAIVQEGTTMARRDVMRPQEEATMAHGGARGSGRGRPWAGRAALAGGARRWPWRALAAGALALGLFGGAGGEAPRRAAAASVVSVCDTTHLIAALAGGGTVTFACSGAITGTSIEVTTDTTLDGAGHQVTIDGFGGSTVFTVYRGAHLTIDGLTITDGAAGPGGAGGAISAVGGAVTLINSTVSGNTAWEGGGISVDGGGSLTLINSTVSGNTAIPYDLGSLGSSPGSGGGISAVGGAVTLINSTVSGNTVQDGLASDGSVRFGNGGGIDNEGATVTLQNSIVAGNTAGRSPDFSGTVTSRGYNLIGDGGGAYGFAPTDLLGADPRLDPLRDNGGPTFTMVLLAGSPAIDAVPAAACVDQDGAPLRADQRGYGRPDDGEARCDSGAYESGAVPPDTSAPTTHASFDGTPGQNGWYTSAGLLRLSATDPDDTATTSDVAATNLSLDGAPFQPYTGAVALGEGRHTVGYYSLDRAGNQETPQALTVDIDTHGPSAPAAAIAGEAHAVGGATWYKGSAAVSYGGSADPALADGTAGSGVAAYSPAQTFASTGHFGYSGTAVDAAGNTSAATSGTLDVDATPPTVRFTSCPSAPLVLGTTGAGAAWVAGDLGSGLATAASGTVALPATRVGPQSVTAPQATDRVGYTSASATCAYGVAYGWRGFAPPIDDTAANPGEAMSVFKAGSAIPVKFQLVDASGAAVQAGSPPAFSASAPYPCAVGSAVQSVSAPAADTASTYRWDSTAQQYIYNFRSSASSAGQCLAIRAMLDDGTTHSVTVAFK